MKKISESFEAFVDSLFEFRLPGESEIRRAVQRDDVEFVRAAIEQGCDINKKDILTICGNVIERSLLEIAAIHNSPKTIELLLAHGARRRRQALAFAELNSKELKGYRRTLHLLRKSLPRRSK